MVELTAETSVESLGIVQDSGIAERTKNLFSMGVVATTSARDKVDTHGTMAENTRIIQISYPVPVPPCNPWRGAPLPATCPYKNCPLAIPHFSAGGLGFRKGLDSLPRVRV